VGLAGGRPLDPWMSDVSLHRLNLVSDATNGK
jgi:hypothetical protein